MQKGIGLSSTNEVERARALNLGLAPCLSVLNHVAESSTVQTKRLTIKGGALGSRHGRAVETGKRPVLSARVRVLSNPFGCAEAQVALRLHADWNGALSAGALVLEEP